MDTQHPTSDQPLAGQLALVTGASRGIGRHVAIALASHGATVAVTARSEESLEHTVNACQAVGGAAHCFAADLSDPTETDALVTRVREALGPISILINNAGFGMRAPIHELDLDRFEAMMRVNVSALFRLSARVAPDLIAASGGAIINIASIAGRTTGAQISAYAASKHAVMGFSGSIFEDLREHGVKVSAICPGYVNTDFVAARDHIDPARMIQPDDVADAILYVLNASSTVCPTEIVLRPQRTPYRSKG